jgi:hypothetical protein
MKKVFAAAAIMVVTAAPALAETCANRDHIVTQLEVQYGEVLMANAISEQNNILEVYGSEQNDTWSVFVYLPDRNLSCLAASGKGLRTIATQLNLDF